MNATDEIKSLRREIRSLRDDIAQRAIKIPAPRIGAIMYLTIVGGNTLSDGTTLGIKLKTGLGGVATVPSLYDPNVTTAFVDGIGRATLTINNVTQSGYVLVVNDQESDTAIQTAMAATWRPITRADLRFIPLASDATQGVYVYTPYFK